MLASMTPILLLAVWFDLRERRIPNGLVLVGILVAFGLSIVSMAGWFGPNSGAWLIGRMLLGMSVGLGTGIALFGLGALGAGDGKLLGVIGAFLGPWGLVTAMLYAGAAGGVLALVGAARRQTLIPVLLRTRDLGLHLLTFGRAGERWSVDSPGAVSIPFAVPIAIGAVLALLVPLLPGGTP